jgi:PEGA domain
VISDGDRTAGGAFVKTAPIGILIALALSLPRDSQAQAPPPAQPQPLAQPQAQPAAGDAAPLPSASASAPAASSAPAVSDEADVGDESGFEGVRPWSLTVSPDERRAARALFLEGNRLFRVPLFARAVAQYRAAIAKWKHPAFYFNLALAQINLDDNVAARESLERAMVYGPEPLGDERFQEARKQLRDLERTLGKIRISCPTKGAEVTLDGDILFTGPGTYENWIEAGDHEVTAKKSGYLSEARKVTVPKAMKQEVDLRLITLNEASDKNRRWAVWKPWVVIAAGTAAAVTGGVFHSRAAASYEAYDDDFLLLPCVTNEGSPGCAKGDIPPSLDKRLDRAALQQKIAIGAYAAGGAILATGAVLLYMNRPRTIEEAPRAGQITIAPDLSPTSLGFVLSVSH